MLSKLAEQVRNCRRMVVLTGAGFSAESGVPTFRGKEGLWGKFKPEELATMEAFMANPKVVWEWYSWRRGLISGVKPNPGHNALVELENQIEDFVLVTQNVDGLHRAAGSRNIVELHGNILHNKCMKCESQYESDTDIDPDNIPTCKECGGRIRPDVVWFGEMLDPETIERAFKVAEKAEICFSIGTSSVVQPAASLPMMAKRSGATLVEVNPEETPITSMADYYFPAKSGEFLPQLLKCLEKPV